MSFKVGDKVRVKKNAGFGLGTSNCEIIGTIIIDLGGFSSKSGYRYQIEWDNGKTDEYYKTDDLEYWFIRPVSDLLKIVGRNEGDKTFNFLKILVTIGDSLSDEELEICKNLWEKYNKN